MHDDEPTPPELSWLRAIVEVCVTLVVGGVLGLVVTNTILTRFGGIGRSASVALATGWFFLVLTGMAWILRRLQARHVV